MSTQPLRGEMLRHQDALPRLPVPTLAETCSLYLRLVRPLLGEADLAATKRSVAEFAGSGQGEVLQERLLRWSKTSAQQNWLEPFWDEWYLCDDTPLPVNVSPGFALARSDRPQVARAARLLAAAAQFKEAVAREQLAPDIEAGGAPRCMREYFRVLCTARIPGSDRDLLEQHPDGRHVVVLRDGAFFALDVLDERGHAWPVDDLERALQRILDEAEPNEPSVGVLTTDRRRAWAREREVLRARTPTRELVEAVEGAILLLVLERGTPPPAPRSREAARLVLHGNVRDRWFDKSIQLVVAENGVAGFCMEHAGFDGSTALRLAEFLVEHEGDSPRRAGTGRAGEAAPKRLRFDVTERARESVERAARGAEELLTRTDLEVLDFRDFGKREIVRHGLSPDGFVQMAFQLSYFTLTGETASTYESVDMKRFLHGRTEAMRCVSEESVSFVRSLRPKRGHGTEAEQLLRAAIAGHTALLRRCKEGRGAERHLLGLRRMVEPDEAPPALFADAGYSTLTRSVLSTSALPSSHGVELTTFGPVVDEGLGLSYTIHDDRICSAVTSFHGLARAFADQLDRSLLEMQALLASSR